MGAAANAHAAADCWPGCRAWRKSQARCACAAALKTKRLSAYGVESPVKLTILMERGRTTAQVTVETLTEAELPAADLQAEQMLLGALYLDNQGFQRLPPQFSAQDFYAPFHQRLFGDMQATVAAGRPAEPIASAEVYHGDLTFEALGGLVYLADMIDRAHVPTDVEGLGDRLHDLAVRRRADSRGVGRAAESLQGPDMLGADAFARLAGMARSLRAGRCWGLWAPSAASAIRPGR